MIRIFRGIPGSGKTTQAREILEIRHVFEADDYFIGENGYEFDPTKLTEAHADCMRRFLKALRDERRDIAVTNTNLRRAEYTPYVQAARAHGRYDIKLVKCECPVDVAASRNVHDVPDAKVREMHRRWEEPAPFDPPQEVIDTS